MDLARWATTRTRGVNRVEKDRLGQRSPHSWEQCTGAHERSGRSVLGVGGQRRGCNERVPDLPAGNREQKTFILIMEIREVFPAEVACELGLGRLVRF